MQQATSQAKNCKNLNEYYSGREGHKAAMFDEEFRNWSRGHSNRVYVRTAATDVRGPHPMFVKKSRTSQDEEDNDDDQEEEDDDDDDAQEQETKEHKKQTKKV